MTAVQDMQRSVRFYDPDGHIIEAGEQMHAAVMRFMHSGLSAEQTAQRMDVPEVYIRSLMQEYGGNYEQD